MKQEPTIRDVMGKLDEITEVMQDFATSVDQRFDAVDQRFDRVEVRLSRVESDIVEVRSGLVEVRSGLGHVKNQMVTKGYLDDKLADHHSDLIIRVRKEDEKVLETVKGWMGKK